MTKFAAGASHHEWEVNMLRSDSELAVEYLKDILGNLDDPEERGVSLRMLRSLAEAYGGIGAIAKQAGVSREHLYRSLSSKGNPTLKTLIAVVNAMGLRLSVVEAKQVKKPRAKAKAARKAA